MPMTPEIMRFIGSPAYRPYRAQAARIVDSLWEPDPEIGEHWYNDMRTETLALLLHAGKVVEPGANVPAAAPVAVDPRVARIEARWPGLIDRLAKPSQ